MKTNDPFELGVGSEELGVELPTPHSQLPTQNYVDILNESKVIINLDLFNSIFTWMKEDNIFALEDTCCLKLSENSEIQDMNNKYRGSNKMTDVLSFPCEIKNIPFKGDIIINTVVADSQKGPRSLEKEIAILFIHGLLHLGGFNHTNKKEQLRMQMYEEKYCIRLLKV